MKRKRNPYLLIRENGLYIFLGIIFAALFSAMIYTFWTRVGWGAWALTIPLILVGVVLLTFLALIPLILLGEAINKRWLKAEREWYERNNQ